MKQLVELTMSVGNPPLTVPLLFVIAYLAVGIPTHFLLGPGAQDYYGTMAGFLVSLAYLTVILMFES